MDITKYKKSAVGFIPIDWDVKKFKEEASFYSGGTPLTSVKEYYSGEIPFIKSGEIYYDKTDQFITAEGLKNSSARMVDQGDILYALYGANSGEVAIAKINGAINQAVLCIKPKENLDIFFIYSFLLAKKETIIKSYLQGGQGNLSAEIIKTLQIPIPPLPEQQKIATILSTCDIAIDNCKAIIENLKNRNIGLAQQLLSGKKRVKGSEKSQWHLKSVEEVAVFKNGKAHENCIDEEGDYFVVNSKFISTQGKVAKASNENLCPLFKNDITMVMSDIPNGKAFAKCFYIAEDDKYTLNQRICALTAKKGTDSKFLYYQMNRNNYYLAFNNGVSQTNLKKEEVLECPLLMPDIEEQIQIVKLIDTATEELNQYQQKLEALQLQKKGLMQQLLTGKTRVKI